MVCKKHIEILGSAFDLCVLNGNRLIKEVANPEDVKLVKDSIAEYNEFHKSIAKVCGINNIDILHKNSLKSILLNME